MEVFVVGQFSLSIPEPGVLSCLLTGVATLLGSVRNRRRQR
jgi:hypothetical protein